ncbi:putative addiction module antidote protein [Rhizobium sp. CG5]|uniref:addiction module antidote protein n=1 Tax=Rhizobium sp. CG5 TaxID=2726076 RepID=UPI00203389C4|nr:addiction module antidote protein [Rhizobium sp. CG5]MCM2473010.1 putative addiction module antidote protein [Rhizobium sp. CG5]
MNGRKGDAGEIRRALNTVARSLGMTAVAEEAGLGRESLYKALGENGNPEFLTILKLMKAMGLKLSALPIDKE